MINCSLGFNGDTGISKSSETCLRPSNNKQHTHNHQWTALNHRPISTRKQREEPSIFIHVSLSGALFLLNSSFLMTEWGATVSPGWVCALIAALVHYSLLGTFTWLAVEGLHLYLMLIKVFNTEYKHYLLKLSLFGWGEYRTAKEPQT